MTFGKKKTQQEDSEEDTTLSRADVFKTNNTKNLNGIMDGQKNTVDTWSILQLSRQNAMQLGLRTSRVSAPLLCELF